MSDDAGFFPPHGNYRELLSYRKAEIVYDLTYHFCHRFLSRTDRTVDQMIQAARSGKQNILEASKASAVSKETEIKLTGIARASLEELMGDYRDSLRLRGLPMWEKESREARFVRRIGSQPDVSYDAYREFCETRSIEVVANIAICLHSPDELSARSTDPPSRTRLRQRRRPTRTYDPRQTTLPRRRIGVGQSTE